MHRIVSVIALTTCVATLGCHDSPLAPAPSTNARLTSLFVACGRWTPAGARCMARGGYSDGGQRDLTPDVTWESSDLTVATVQAGQVTFVSPGEVTIRASYPPYSGSSRMSTVHAGPP